MVHLEAVGEVAYAGAAIVSVGDDDDLVAPVHELRRQLVDVTLDTSWLREEEVANHGNVVRGRHLCGVVAVAGNRPSSLPLQTSE